MHYINDLTDGSSVREIYLCKKRQALVTRAGKSYESLTFQDKTGTIDAKIWDPDSMGIGEFGEMDYVDVSGEVITYQGHLQLNVRRARLCHEGEYDPANYLPVSERNVEDMYRTILKFVDSIENTWLKRLLEMFFVEDTEFVKAFKTSSAAKSVHHGFIGGLCEAVIMVQYAHEAQRQSKGIRNHGMRDARSQDAWPGLSGVGNQILAARQLWPRTASVRNVRPGTPLDCTEAGN